ncbi:MAG: DNA polymerase I [Dehalococcoidia bacterium]|nr:DNA polymerase I [Dehalococcoidia bacterium]
MSPEKPVLLLFDGNAIVHRAFHALPPLTVSKTGEIVGAVYGFASTLLKVQRELKPTHWAVAFDYPAPTFRRIQFEEYKAHRPKAPDELVAQFHRVRELVAAFSIPVFELQGYEADDVIGTLCRQATDLDVDTLIVSGDMDTMQLVSPRVKVVIPKPGRAFSETVLYDEGLVRERYGVSPRQMADLKALAGDASDNIPGVRGIGEKTASRLVQQFGSIEGIYSHLEEVTPERVRELLRSGQEIALKSKELTTIVLDVPITLEMAACQVSHYDRARVVALFRELEFSTLLSKLPEQEAPAGAAERPAPTMFELGEAAVSVSRVQGDYQVVNTTDSLDRLVAELGAAPVFALNVVATEKSPRQAELVGIAFSTSANKAHYVPLGHRNVTLGDDNGQLPVSIVLDKLRAVLASGTGRKVAHDAKSDMTVLARHGVVLDGLTFDTMIAAHLLGEKALGLKPLAFGHLGFEAPSLADVVGTKARKTSIADLPIPQAMVYACVNVDITNRLADKLGIELGSRSLGKLFHDVEMPLIPLLFRMEQAGVALDTALLGELSQRLRERLSRLELDIYNAIGHMFNVNSSQQLSGVLFDELGLPKPRKTKGGYSTEAAILEGLRDAHPVIPLMLEYRQASKLKSTYIDALPALIDPRTGRVHTTFNQTGTVTGRLSSSDPNLQNIPIRSEEGKQVRRAFIAGQEAWRLVSADYSQIDLRVLAHLSQDPRLVAAFSADEDVHAATASEIFGVSRADVTSEMRRVAKTVNFGVIYGMSEFGLAQGTDLSRQEAAQFISAYFEKYSGVKKYLTETKQKAAAEGYVETLLGRRRYIPEIKAGNPQIRMAAERMAINMPVQGTSADVIKVAMIELQRRMDQRGLQSRMLLQVHDELIFETPEVELEEMKALALEVMPGALPLSVPLKVSVNVGKNWGEME